MKYLLPLILMGMFTAESYAALIKQAVSYKAGDTVLQGYLVYDDAVKGKRPGIILFHEWWGVNPYIKMRAEEVAKLGYVAFAADIYGNGMVAKDQQEAGKLAGSFRANPPLMLGRATAGLNELLKNDLVDKTRIAAMGYCFGGGVALELARSGVDLSGVVTFHGNLDTKNPESNGNIKAKVLVLHGADDPFVNSKIVNDFEDSMRKTKVDWQVVLYSGAVHGFTNPDNGNDPSKGLAYNMAADKRSWAAMRSFYEEIFAR